MQITLQQVLDYIDTHPLRFQDGNFDSFLDMLHTVYTESNPVDSEEIRQGFASLRPILNELSPEAADILFAQVCDLCLLHEKTAFAHGLTAGLYLHTELSTLSDSRM